ncbi:uncharacterized protein [Venturia canescens]|uniref:uncharacterized protein isoform X2 n=1 Tax=Venturia canescens TaxID=32260 RepID=UPI001C9C1DE0|nr:uncharacterized protein LOC122413762 isoform X2 [Venturia canescens]
MSRRPSISIYDYPEDLNPFNDDSTTTATTTTNGTKKINHEAKNSVKDSKHKFWTFGRSKKKQRSNSFSIKTTWNGLFGKRRDSQEVEIRKPTIATVSSTYKRGTYNGYPSTPARLSKDQQEFNEALGTLARRRKYTLDNSSRYSSTLTVNGDPGKLCEPCPQDTTTCILENLTPKAPARRFGQVSPKPTDKIPSLDYSGKENTSNGSVSEERAPNRTPIPPKRGGPRASQRSLAPIFLNDEGSSRSADTSIRDENENVPEDYVFKRFNQDAIRKSNLSINSCVSVGSTVSAYGRKKRRAPQPPCIKEPLETPKETDAARAPEADVSKTEVEIVDIARVTENIDEMTKRSRELDDNVESTCSTRASNGVDDEKAREQSEGANKFSPDEKTEEALRMDDEGETESRKSSTQVVEIEDGKAEETSESVTSPEEGRSKSCELKDDNEQKKNEVDVGVELRRRSDDRAIETLKEAEVYSSTEEFTLTRRKSSGNLSRSSSFSVKDEIEKIERQIKILESTKARDSSDEEVSDNFERAGTRMSLRETRNNFFRELTENDRVKVQLKELPREQNDIRIVRIEDPPISTDGPTEPVKIIELHISEPIRQKPAIIVDRDINPIPKPRRHSNLDIVNKESRVKARREKEDEEKRGNSL